MNIKAEEKLFNLIKGSLQNLQIASSTPCYESNSETLTKIYGILKKDNKIQKYVRKIDVVSIYADHVHGVLTQKISVEQEHNGSFKSLLKINELESLAEKIKNFYLSIPRPYEIYIPISLKEHSEISSVKLTDNHEIKVYKKGETLPFLIVTSSFNISRVSDQNYTFLKIKSMGYCQNDLTNPTIIDALSKYKIFNYLAIRENFLTHFPNTNSGNFHKFGLPHSIPRVSIFCTDNEIRDVTMTVDLPIDYCRFIESTQINPVAFKVKTFGNLPLNEGFLKNKLNYGLELLDSDVYGSKNIKSAIEWYFDCLLHENQNIAFILMCIGLEALFDSDSTSITSLLTDRYAYIAGATIKQRDKLKKDLKELYELRSKFVHGRVKTLQDDELIHFERGKSILLYAIKSEIKRLDFSERTN